MTDLDILRKIRDANPTSQLPSLWLDNEDPYTQWEGVYWYADKVSVETLSMYNIGISNLNDIRKLSKLRQLECGNNPELKNLNVSYMKLLRFLKCNRCGLILLDVTGGMLTDLYCDRNELINISTLTSMQRLSIPTSYFVYNRFDAVEIQRLRALGFTDESKLLPQKS